MVLKLKARQKHGPIAPYMTMERSLVFQGRVA